MNLQEFITQTIEGIVDATSQLQKKYETEGIIINPPISDTDRDSFREGSDLHTFRRIEIIEFDVAVTAASESVGGGKAGLRIFSAEAGLEGKHERRSEEISRVRFSIPIVLAPSNAERKNRDQHDQESARIRQALTPRSGATGHWLTR
ncbi:hypothetical protein [Pararhodobacter oceanensis]|uniref:hypothetical protein n=1 Tax=Pararhodobacter oceanensis TaxID=2172121 RepID=UPI003A8F0EC8